MAEVTVPIVPITSLPEVTELASGATLVGEQSGNAVRMAASLFTTEVTIDKTLTQEDKAAEAKATGDRIAAEATARESGDTLLQSQIDQIISPSGEAPSAAEVENARIDVDGETHATLGEAIRGQVGNLKSALSLSFVTPDNYELGDISISTSGWTYSSFTTRIRIKQGTTIRLYKGDTIGIVENSAVQFCIGWLNDNGRYNKSKDWIKTFTCPVTADYVILARFYPEVAISNVADVADNIIINSAVNVKSIKTTQNDVIAIENHNKTVNDIVGIYNADVSNFDIGNITITNGGWTYAAGETRVRTKSGFTIALKKNDTIGLTDYSNARMYIGYQRSDGTYGTSGGWKTSDYTCPENGNYVILLCHSSDEYLNSIEELLSLLQIIIKPEDLSETVNEILSGKRYSFPGKYGMWSTPPLTWKRSKYNEARVITYDFDVSNFKGIIYSLPSGFEAGVLLLREDGTQYRDTGWDSTGIGYRVLGGARYARIVIRKSNDGPITTDEITNEFVFKLCGAKQYTYNDGPIQTIFHRGCSNIAPENTLTAFKYAAMERAVYVETDVRYTSDGIAVLLHDESINRTARNADGTQISSTINIEDITYEEALEYDFGIWKGASFAGTKIPTFDEFCELCALYELHPVVDLKGELIAERIKALYQTAIKYGLKGRISWISNAWRDSLAPLTEVDSAVDFWWLSNLDSSHATEAIGLKTASNRIVLDAGIAYATSQNQTIIDTLKASGIDVAFWTAESEQDFNNLANLRGITGITTNGADAVVALHMTRGDIA